MTFSTGYSRLLATLVVGFVLQNAEQKRDADDATQLIEVLNLRPGLTVADIKYRWPRSRCCRDSVA